MRIGYFDSLRLFACCLVVFSHTVGAFIVTRLNLIPETPWLFSNAVWVLVRISVSIFFMVSGALMLKSKKTENTLYVWKKRAGKFVFLLVAWSLIHFIMYSIFIEGYTFRIKDFFTGLLGNNITASLWYLYAIIMVSFLIQFIKKITIKFEKK